MIQKDISITINSVDLSSSLRGLEFDDGYEAVSAEAHGSDYRWFERGLQTGPITAQLKQDFTSGGVDETVSALPATFEVVIKPASGAVSGTNPSFTCTMMLESYQRFTGNIGELAICTVQLAVADADGWARSEGA